MYDKTSSWPLNLPGKTCNKTLILSRGAVTVGATTNWEKTPPSKICLSFNSLLSLVFIARSLPHVLA